MEGYIKLFRKIIKWEWYKKSEMVHLFLHFLLLASHEDNKWQGKIIKKGQFVTGLESLAENTGISRQTIRTCIDRLKSTGEITNESTNRNRLITIINWEQYQPINEKLTGKSTDKLTNNQQTTNKQLTANKNDKNVKNDNNKIRLRPEVAGIQTILDIFYKINPGIAFNNKTSRSAAEWLISKSGLEQAVRISNYACAVQSQKYAPVITTPYELKIKLGALKIFADKQKSKQVIKLD